MSDLDRQWIFTELVARWILAAYARGYRLSGGDWYRDPRANFPYSSPNSFHARRLAFDVNVFRSGEREPVTGDGPDWQKLGALWVQLGGTWGGRFQGRAAGDFNHLSMGEGI